MWGSNEVQRSSRLLGCPSPKDKGFFNHPRSEPLTTSLQVLLLEIQGTRRSLRGQQTFFSSSFPERKNIFSKFAFIGNKIGAIGLLSATIRSIQWQMRQIKQSMIGLIASLFSSLLYQHADDPLPLFQLQIKPLSSANWIPLPVSHCGGWQGLPSGLPNITNEGSIHWSMKDGGVLPILKVETQLNPSMRAQMGTFHLINLVLSITWGNRTGCFEVTLRRAEAWNTQYALVVESGSGMVGIVSWLTLEWSGSSLGLEGERVSSTSTHFELPQQSRGILPEMLTMDCEMIFWKECGGTPFSCQAVHECYLHKSKRGHWSPEEPRSHLLLLSPAKSQGKSGSGEYAVIDEGASPSTPSWLYWCVPQLHKLSSSVQ
jgi:hypothetical protein